MTPLLCPDRELQDFLEAAQARPEGQAEALQRLVERYPDDGRLFFMLGSNLVGAGRLIEGRTHLVRAVDLAPDFHIARFQLGLFQLTSGEAIEALATWGRLDLLNNDHYLRWFVDGLRALIRDEFETAISHLRRGIEINGENAPLNNDMQLLIEQLSSSPRSQSSGAEEVSSETDFMLRQFGARPRSS